LECFIFFWKSSFCKFNVWKIVVRWRSHNTSKMSNCPVVFYWALTDSNSDPLHTTLVDLSSLDKYSTNNSLSALFFTCLTLLLPRGTKLTLNSSACRFQLTGYLFLGVNNIIE
jgi:hypothetical protein